MKSLIHLDRRLTIERPLADNSFKGAGSGTWVPVATVWASVKDGLSSRSEQLSAGINSATRSAKVVVRYRTGITNDMRFVMGGRVMQIVSGPAEIGRREWLEFVVEDYSTAGNSA